MLSDSEMEPPEEIHEASAYNLAEIWPFPINNSGGIGASEANLELNHSSLYHFDSPDGVKRRDSPEGEDQSNCNGKRAKAKVEGDGEQKGVAFSEQPKPEYIHVRARRGQATDSHSLAERARREKISDRMKILQELVPGCNKVVGKALVLDEIINYIQSLQRQVELEAVTSRMNPGIEGFPPKDFGQQAFDAAFGPQTARDFGRGSSPEWLHMQIGSGFGRT